MALRQQERTVVWAEAPWMLWTGAFWEEQVGQCFWNRGRRVVGTQRVAREAGGVGGTPLGLEEEEESRVEIPTCRLANCDLVRVTHPL